MKSWAVRHDGETEQLDLEIRGLPSCQFVNPCPAISQGEVSRTIKIRLYLYKVSYTF